ncbi:hypothetical protein GCM10022281_02910 [Sphingomonas rosea]|uniref:Uncharacterized protein n=1 Tax=Sphingomonas rosea TaxID=335605 RepID=A0ABP7TKF8_9SPHN
MSDLHRQSAPEGEYFAQRAETERRRAAEASDPRARAVHLQLAQEYDDLSECGAAND